VITSTGHASSISTGPQVTHLRTPLKMILDPAHLIPLLSFRFKKKRQLSVRFPE
jgi:hypothetical protein